MFSSAVIVALVSVIESNTQCQIAPSFNSLHASFKAAEKLKVLLTRTIWCARRKRFALSARVTDMMASRFIDRGTRLNQAVGIDFGSTRFILFQPITGRQWKG